MNMIKLKKKLTMGILIYAASTSIQALRYGRTDWAECAQPKEATVE